MGIGAYQQDTSKQAALNYDAAIQEQNARIADEQAQQAAILGQQQQNAQQLKDASVAGDAKAIAAANGGVLGEGSNAEIIRGNAYLAQVNSLTIQDTTARQQWAYQMQAVNARNTAAADRAGVGAINPGMDAASGLLGTGAQVAQIWYALKGSGALSGIGNLFGGSGAAFGADAAAGGAGAAEGIGELAVLVA